MTDSQFLDAVALGKITPGPVMQTVAAVGTRPRDRGWTLRRVAPSLPRSRSYSPAPALRRASGQRGLRSFLTAGPAAIGAILGGRLPLALALTRLGSSACSRPPPRLLRPAAGVVVRRFLSRAPPATLRTVSAFQLKLEATSTRRLVGRDVPRTAERDRAAGPESQRRGGERGSPLAVGLPQAGIG